MDIHVQPRLVHPVVVERAGVEQVEVAQVEVEAAVVVQACLNVRREMELLQTHVLVNVVQHLAQHQLG